MDLWGYIWGVISVTAHDWFDRSFLSRANPAHDVMIHTIQHKFNKLKVSLFLGEEQDDAHSDKDDKVGQDVEAEERVRLLRVGALPGLVPKQQDQWVDGLRVQPAAAERERGSDKNSWWGF